MVKLTPLSVVATERVRFNKTTKTQIDDLVSGLNNSKQFGIFASEKSKFNERSRSMKPVFIGQEDLIPQQLLMYKTQAESFYNSGKLVTAKKDSFNKTSLSFANYKVIGEPNTEIDIPPPVKFLTLPANLQGSIISGERPTTYDKELQPVCLCRNEPCEEHQLLRPSVDSLLELIET